MRGLPEVLHEAAQEQATEIILEAGRAPMARRDGETLAMGSPWTERQLFDALENVLGPEQLAELAVGHVVEFTLEMEGHRWTLLGEATTDGVVVRGRLRTSISLELGSPLELPPLDPFVPDDDALSVPLHEGSRVTGEHWVPTTSPRGRGDRRLAMAAAADERPDWVIGNDEGRWASTPMPLADTGEVLDLRAESEPEADLPELIEPDFSVGEDDTQEVAVNGAAMDEDAAAEDDEYGLAAAPLFERGDRTVSMRSQRETIEDLRGVRSGEYRLPFSKMAAGIPPGAIVWMQGVGVAELLVEQIEGEYCCIDDDETSVSRATALMRRELVTLVVRRQDPSPILGWLLGRAEEGARVVIETRARTLVGARRILLGVSHGPHARAWLDAIPVYWISERSGQWGCEGPIKPT